MSQNSRIEGTVENLRRDRARLTAERDALAARVETLENVAEFMWTIICNVSEGDWTKQTQEWQEAAVRAREQWHAALASRPAGEEETT